MPSLKDHESCMLRRGSNLWCTVHGGGGGGGVLVTVQISSWGSKAVPSRFL